MKLALVGLNHKTAPLEIREKVHFPSLEFFLKQLMDISTVKEGVILSTCNRVEICAVTSREEDLSHFISESHGYDTAELKKHLYSLKEKEALLHTFRVASSLDSMVIGEPQILGQVKAAYRLSQKANTVGPVLHRVYQKAFHAAKRVRSETAIATKPLSIGSVVVQLCQKIFDHLENKNILLVGYGEMMKNISDLLFKKGIKQFYVTNRSEHSLLSGTFLPLHEFPKYLHKMDIVLVSTRSPSFIITKEMMNIAIQERKQNPLFCIDISVPRNVDPESHKIENIYLYNIDDLDSIVKENTKNREQEAYKAEKIVLEEVDKFYA